MLTSLRLVPRLAELGEQGTTLTWTSRRLERRAALVNEQGMIPTRICRRRGRKTKLVRSRTVVEGMTPTRTSLHHAARARLKDMIPMRTCRHPETILEEQQLQQHRQRGDHGMTLTWTYLHHGPRQTHPA